MRRLLVAVLVCLAVASIPGPAQAQAREESRLLREAAALESRGDFDGAEEMLRRLLTRRPSSSGGLFALERVLRAKGEPEAILPVADSFLAHDASSSGVRYLKLRVLAEVDSLDALEEAAEQWFATGEGGEGPYREVARVYERTFGADRALEVLRRGRAAGRDPSALALEIGDLLVTSGEREQALDEWVLAVGDDGSEAVPIARRVAGLTEGSKEAGSRVVQSLSRASEPGRRRAAAQIALELGLEDEALAIVARVADDLQGRARTSFLADVARRGREGGMGSVASWAYGELGQDAASPAERRQFDQRLVELSLTDGDTTAALEAQERVVASFTSGSADRRRATAELIRLEAGTAPSDVLKQHLDQFREEFAGAPELDDLGATVAGALLSRGEAAGAADVLEGIQGPRSSVERGYLLLDDGQVAQGRGALLMAVSGLDPAEATEVIQFAGLLNRLSPAGTQLMAQAGVLAHQGHGEAAATLLVDSIHGLEPDDRAAVLSEGARMAERGGAGDLAADLRSRLLIEHADAPEAAEASLELARFRAQSPGGMDEAIRLLEELVTSRPNAAVAPDARRELERLLGRGGA